MYSVFSALIYEREMRACVLYLFVLLTFHAFSHNKNTKKKSDLVNV